MDSFRPYDSVEIFDVKSAYIGPGFIDMHLREDQESEIKPKVWKSSNIPGGDTRNREYKGKSFTALSDRKLRRINQGYQHAM